MLLHGDQRNTCGDRYCYVSPLVSPLPFDTISWSCSSQGSQFEAFETIYTSAGFLWFRSLGAGFSSATVLRGGLLSMPSGRPRRLIVVIQLAVVPDALIRNPMA